MFAQPSILDQQVSQFVPNVERIETNHKLLKDFQKFDAWKTQNATALKASLATKLGMQLGPYLIQRGGTNSIVVPMDDK